MQETAQPIISGTEGVPEGSMAWWGAGGSGSVPARPRLLPASPLLGPSTPRLGTPGHRRGSVAQPRRLPGDPCPSPCQQGMRVE